MALHDHPCLDGHVLSQYKLHVPYPAGTNRLIAASASPLSQTATIIEARIESDQAYHRIEPRMKHDVTVVSDRERITVDSQLNKHNAHILLAPARNELGNQNIDVYSQFHIDSSTEQYKQCT